MIISTDLVKELESVLIDEEGKHALTKIVKTKGGTKSRKSDHNTIISKFNISWNKKVKAERVEIYNLKNKEGQDKFKELTTKDEELSMIFENVEDIDKATEIFINKVNKHIKSSFNKIRITEKPNKEVEELFTRRKELRNKTDDISIRELNNVELRLADLCANSNYSKIMEEIIGVTCANFQSSGKNPTSKKLLNNLERG